VTIAAVVGQLRTLIVTAAPDPCRRQPCAACPTDVPLDTVMPFSSVITLGVIVAVEDRFDVVVTRSANSGGVRGRRHAREARDHDPASAWGGVE